MTLRRIALFVGVAVLLTSTAIVWRAERPGVRPSVLLITIDTLRPDHLSVYGSPFRETPAIDRLAAGGAVFDSAHCDVTWTTPSMASTFTGMYAMHHGFKSPYDRLSDDNVTLAEVLRAAGYQTGAVVGSYPLDSTFGLDQGFDVYDDDMVAPLLRNAAETIDRVGSKRFDDVQAQQDWNFLKTANDSMRPDDQVTDAATALLTRFRRDGRPFFLWVHYFGPHDLPDARLDGYQNSKIHLDTYVDKVVRVDTEVQRLLGALGEEAARMLVILHADHGESLGEHNFVGHGRYLYEDNLRVPLIVRWPQYVPAGVRVRALVGNIDITPTILDAAGLSSSVTAMDGRSLLQTVRDGSTVHPMLYGETYMPADRAFAEVVAMGGEDVAVGVRRFSVLSPPWKYVVTEPYPIFGAKKPALPEVDAKVARADLFNLLLDPTEEHSVIGTPEEPSDRFRLVLAKLRERADLRAAGQVHVTGEHLEKLRSLGYVQ